MSPSTAGEKRRKKKVAQEKENRKQERELKRKQKEEEQKRKSEEKVHKAAEREAAKAKMEAAKAEREAAKAEREKELQTLCEGEKRQTTMKMWKRTVEGYVPFVSMHTNVYYNNLSCRMKHKILIFSAGNR